MIKKIWTWKKIILIIILLMIIIVLLKSLNLAFVANELDVALIFLATFIFFLYFLLKTAYPPKFECMRVVKRYLSFKELKNFIEQEKFEIFRVENISDPFELYYSDKWLFINDVYIPRKLILDGVAIKESFYSSFGNIIIMTKNGERIFLAKVKSEEMNKAILQLKKSFVEIKEDINNIKVCRNRLFYKQLKKEFRENISSKEEFIRYFCI